MARVGSGSDLEIISRKNLEKFTVGDCGEAAIPHLQLSKIVLYQNGLLC